MIYASEGGHSLNLSTSAQYLVLVSYAPPQKKYRFIIFKKSYTQHLIFRYDGDDVPDTMNVHGVYDTSTSMHSFYSRQEYQKFLQRQAGMSGSLFGFYAGVKKAWGSSEVRGSEKYMSLLSINVDR